MRTCASLASKLAAGAAMALLVLASSAPAAAAPTASTAGYLSCTPSIGKPYKLGKTTAIVVGSVSCNTVADVIYVETILESSYGGRNVGSQTCYNTKSCSVRALLNITQSGSFQGHSLFVADDGANGTDGGYNIQSASVYFAP